MRNHYMNSRELNGFSEISFFHRFTVSLLRICPAARGTFPPATPTALQVTSSLLVFVLNSYDAQNEAEKVAQPSPRAP